MLNIADLTVKKMDGLTNQTWTAIHGSAGDKSPALWRNQDVGGAPALNPSAVVTARSNTTGTVRRVEGSISWPFTVTGTDGVVKKTDTYSLSFTAVVPMGVARNTVVEAVVQSTNVLVTQLVRDSVIDGYAPN